MFTLYENPMFRHSIECWITVYALMTSGCIPNDIAHTISTTMAFQKKKKINYHVSYNTRSIWVGLVKYVHLLKFRWPRSPQITIGCSTNFFVFHRKVSLELGEGRCMEGWFRGLALSSGRVARLNDHGNPREWSNCHIVCSHRNT